MAKTRFDTPPPSLHTERLTLRIPESADAGALLDYAKRNDEPHRPWSPPTPPNAFTLKTTDRRIQQMQEDWRNGSSVRLWMRERSDPEGPFLGSVNLSRICLGAFRCAGVGYHVDHEREGQGLMSEALHAVIRFAFDELHLHRLEANFIPTNQRSAKVLERAGFVVEGYARRYLFINGELRDHVLTSLHNPELDNPERFLELMHG